MKRRPAISTPTNRAEGFKKKTKPDNIKYMNIAQGSFEEYRCYLFLAKDLGYENISLLMSQLEEVSKLLEVYAASILDSGS